MTLHATPGPSGHWHNARLCDGSTVLIRAIRASDVTALVAFHATLSANTIYRRFFSPHRMLSPTEARHFTSVDYRDRFALVAILDNHIVGVARYERHDRDVAEIAFVVADSQQNQGIGSLMLADLALIARTQGIVAFDADTLTTSDSVVRMFRAAGFRVRTTDGAGVLHVEFPISCPDRSTAAS